MSDEEISLVSYIYHNLIYATESIMALNQNECLTVVPFNLSIWFKKSVHNHCITFCGQFLVSGIQLLPWSYVLLCALFSGGESSKLPEAWGSISYFVVYNGTEIKYPLFLSCS